MKIAAMLPVTKNIPIMVEKIFLSRCNSVMLAIAEATLKNTRGTIIIKSKFKKISPKGFKITACGPQTYPVIPPIKIDNKRMIENR